MCWLKIVIILAVIIILSILFDRIQMHNVVSLKAVIQVFGYHDRGFFHFLLYRVGTFLADMVKNRILLLNLLLLDLGQPIYFTRHRVVSLERPAHF